MLCALTVAAFFAVLSFSRVLPIKKRQYGYGNFFAPLRFTSNGTFQISIFEDLHFGESMTYLLSGAIIGPSNADAQQMLGMNGDPSKTSTLPWL